MGQILSHPGLQIRASLLLGSILICTSLSGCTGGNSTGGDAGDESSSSLTAKEVLDKMAEVYQSAEGYADSGDVFFSAKHGGHLQADPPLPFSIAYQRPDKARLHLFDAGIVIDGETIKATVRDVPGQILQVPAPDKFSLLRMPKDQILNDSMNRGVTLLRPWPMLLLTNPDALTSLLAGAESPELLDADTTQEHQCFRVRISHPTSEQILWIDQKDFLLRRMDFGGAALRRQLSADSNMTEVRAKIEFTGAQLNPEFPENTFAFEVPGEAKLVRQLVPPVAVPPPALGQKIGEFMLPTKQEPLQRGNLVGKITVLCFWSTTEQNCRRVLPELEILKEKYRQESEVQFFAVSEDPSVVTPETIKQTLLSWGSTLPILRDPDGAAKEAMFTETVPTVLVIGGDARIHDMQVGGAFSAAEVDRAIEGLLRGDDVATYLLKQYETLQKNFRAEIEQVSVTDSSTQIEIPYAVVSPRTEPKNLNLQELWKAPGVEQPGNVLVIPTEEGDSRVIVFDGWRTLVEISPTGEEVARHEMEIPEGAVASYLRTAVNGEGKRWFVASSVNQQQLFLLDEDLNVTLNFPDERHAGIADVQLADLAGTGKLSMIVGYWGTVGVQGVSLEGERKWSNRSLENVLQIVIGSKNESGQRRALCYNTSGTLIPIDAKGEAGLGIQVPGRTLANLAGEDVNGDGKVDLCALAIDPQNLGSFTAIGIDEQGQELWSYALPTGNHNYVVERIVPARLGPNDGGWLLPGADGSIHLLTVTGELVDRFDYGASLTGLGLAQFDGTPALLVSTPDSFTAWKLTPKEISTESEGE